MAFETHQADMDPAPLFQGLPQDRCQCPHWGVVLSGRIIFRYGVTRALSEKLVAFLETGTVPEGLFRPDVFLDLTMPTQPPAPCTQPPATPPRPSP